VELFLHLWNIAIGNRTRLLPENVQKLLFLKHNLKATGFDTVNLPIFAADVDTPENLTGHPAVETENGSEILSDDPTDTEGFSEDEFDEEF